MPPTDINESPEVRFQVPFVLIGKSTMVFLTNQSWRVFKFCYTAGGPEHGVWRFLSGGLNQSLVSSVGQAKRRKSITFDSYLRLVSVRFSYAVDFHNYPLKGRGTLARLLGCDALSWAFPSIVQPQSQSACYAYKICRSLITLHVASALAGKWIFVNSLPALEKRLNAHFA